MSEAPRDGVSLETRRTVARMANRARDGGDVTGWFERLYAGAAFDPDAIPWADRQPNHELVTLAERDGLRGAGEPALVVGCGLGDDAEYLARRGFAVTAMDVSPTAIEWCRRRFPGSSVDYQVADLFDPPAAYAGAFALVLEIFTVQSLPLGGDEPRRRALERIASFVAADGRLVLIARGRDDDEPVAAIPWPLSRAELAVLGACGLRERSFEDYVDRTGQRRFRAVYGPSSSSAQELMQ